MKNLLKLGKYVQRIIDFFAGFDKAMKTISAFKSSLEMFEEERVKIWAKKEKDEPKKSIDGESTKSV